MNKEEALNILITNAVCSNNNLFCDEHCPNFDETKRDSIESPCKANIYADDNTIAEAVKILLKKD